MPRGRLDHVTGRHEWRQTDLGCKAEAYNLYLGATMDVATREVHILKALTWRSAFNVFSQVHEPVLQRHGFARRNAFDKGGENLIYAYACEHAAEHQQDVEVKYAFVKSVKNVRIERCASPSPRVAPACLRLHRLTVAPPHLVALRRSLGLWSFTP